MEKNKHSNYFNNRNYCLISYKNKKKVDLYKSLEIVMYSF